MVGAIFSLPGGSSMVVGAMLWGGYNLTGGGFRLSGPQSSPNSSENLSQYLRQSPPDNFLAKE